MYSTSERTEWTQSAELLGTHNYASYALPSSGGTLTGDLDVSNHLVTAGTLKVNSSTEITGALTVGGDISGGLAKNLKITLGSVTTTYNNTDHVEIKITPSTIGAAAASHTHTFADITGKLPIATATSDGAMSSTDKAKIDTFAYNSGYEEICNRLEFDYGMVISNSNNEKPSLNNLNGTVELLHSDCEGNIPWHSSYSGSAATPLEYPDFIYVTEGNIQYVFIKVCVDINLNKIIYFNQYKSIYMEILSATEKGREKYIIFSRGASEEL